MILLAKIGAFCSKTKWRRHDSLFRNLVQWAEEVTARQGQIYADCSVFSRCIECILVRRERNRGLCTYRAVVSFLAERYSRPDKEHGWISHWIVFNEVDYGWIWTNMGETPMALYMDAYDKAMRLTWLEVSRYNPSAEVFISLTHHWQYSPADKFRAYPPRTLLDRMALYTERTGDYH